MSQYHIEPHTQECMLGAGIKRKINANGLNALDGLQKFIDERRSWLFGQLCYDLKTGNEQVSSIHADEVQFPDLFFFEPEIVIRLNENELIIDSEEPAEIFAEINSQGDERKSQLRSSPVVEGRIPKNEYLSIIRQLRRHILRGDCYEINFCQEFFAEKTIIDPGEVYKRLVSISPNPFSALYRVDDKWLICASPERFLKKQGSRILSQPIKGTSRRDPGIAAVAEPADLDVLGIGNALVDVLSQADDELVARLGLVKGTMSLVDEARARGLLLLKCGPHKNVVRLLPPLIATTDDVARAVDILSYCIPI